MPDKVTEWLTKDQGELLVPNSVVERTKCSFCWQGVPTPKVSDHVAKDCLLLKKFNSKQATQKFRPIRIEKNTIVVDTSKEPVSAEEVAKIVEKMAADFKDKLLEMEKRLKAVEKNSKPPQKRKAEDPDSEPSRPAKKKKGNVNDDAGTSGEQPPKEGKKGRKKGKKGKDVTPA